MKHFIFLSTIFFVAMGCAVTPEQQNRLQNQVFSIRQIQKKQDQTLQETQSKLAEMEKNLQEIDQRSSQAVSQKTDSVRSNQADLSSSLESQRIKIATLMGTQEELERSLNEVSSNTQEQSQQVADIEERLTTLEQSFQQVISQMGIELEEKQHPPDQRSGRATGQAETTQPKEITPDFLYEQALQDFNNRKYTSAISLWADMIKSFPDHDLVPNAYFWQGEAFYQLQDYANAALKYNEVIEKYPKTTKYPAALLKQGLSYYALDKNKAGRLRLDELIKKFPDRAEAKRARTFLNNR